MWLTYKANAVGLPGLSGWLTRLMQLVYKAHAVGLQGPSRASIPSLTHPRARKSSNYTVERQLDPLLLTAHLAHMTVNPVDYFACLLVPALQVNGARLQGPLPGILHGCRLLHAKPVVGE